ncbi:MAG: hypothetical protein QM757_33355, partial [Paludibaculum sp.]
FRALLDEVRFRELIRVFALLIQVELRLFQQVDASFVESSQQVIELGTGVQILGRTSETSS